MASAKLKQSNTNKLLTSAADQVKQAKSDAIVQESLDKVSEQYTNESKQPGNSKSGTISGEAKNQSENGCCCGVGSILRKHIFQLTLPLNYIFAHWHPWMRYYVPLPVIAILMGYDIWYIYRMFNQLPEHVCSDCCISRKKEKIKETKTEHSCCIWSIRLFLTLGAMAFLFAHYVGSNSNHAYPIVCWEFGCLIASVIMGILRHEIRGQQTTALQAACLEEINTGNDNSWSGSAMHAVTSVKDRIHNAGGWIRSWFPNNAGNSNSPNAKSADKDKIEEERQQNSAAFLVEHTNVAPKINPRTKSDTALPKVNPKKAPKTKPVDLNKSGATVVGAAEAEKINNIVLGDSHKSHSNEDDYDKAYDGISDDSFCAHAPLHQSRTKDLQVKQCLQQDDDVSLVFEVANNQQNGSQSGSRSRSGSGSDLLDTPTGKVDAADDVIPTTQTQSIWSRWRDATFFSCFTRPRGLPDLIKGARPIERKNQQR